MTTLSKRSYPNNIMMCLGNYQFSVDTAAYQRLRHASSYRWQAQNRIGRIPAQQYLGPGTESVELSGIILPHYKGGLGQIEAMKSCASLGKPLTMVVAWQAAGKVMGEWCITAIEETQTAFSVNGLPMHIEFNLSLVVYGEDNALPYA